MGEFGKARPGLNASEAPSYSCFGQQYDDRLCDLIYRHLDFDTNDRLLYIEPDHRDHGLIVPLLCEKFFLTEPVTRAVIGQSSREIGGDRVMLDSLFSSEESRKFTKIILKDSILYAGDFSALIPRLYGILSLGGKILAIHRPASMNTLPIYETAKEQLLRIDLPLENIVSTSARFGLDVEYKFESLKCLASSQSWISMLKIGSPPPMEKLECSRSDIDQGVRELNSGTLRYLGDQIEFLDQLMFMTICSRVRPNTRVNHRHLVNTTSEHSKRHLPNTVAKFKQDSRTTPGRVVTVEVDDDLEKCLDRLKKDRAKQQTYNRLF